MVALSVVPSWLRRQHKASISISAKPIVTLGSLAANRGLTRNANGRTVMDAQNATAAFLTYILTTTSAPENPAALWKVIHTSLNLQSIKLWERLRQSAVTWPSQPLKAWKKLYRE